MAPHLVQRQKKAQGLASYGGQALGAHQGSVMDMEKLTERARGFMQAAQTIALREQN